jgi:hypothetical protein
MASGVDGTVVEFPRHQHDLTKVEAELPKPESARPVICRNYGCDWIGTTRELEQQERQENRVHIGPNGQKVPQFVTGLHCPQCGSWYSHG